MKKMDNQSETHKSKRLGRIVLFVLFCIVLLVVAVFWNTIEDYIGKLICDYGCCLPGAVSIE